MSERYLSLIAEADFPESESYAAVVGGWYVLATKDDKGYNALNDRCTHAASLLSTGRMRRGTVMCPLHGARFELASGKCIGGAYRDLRMFPVRVVDGQIEVAVPEEKPSMADLPIGG
ncbi:Rieske (2Fe-2S) protein [Novosphingobium lentum]|uniref:Rieske (2Fe-2S) protein n=1 Tax=Novosphingobium lentum TaxID=145287 RepID=UPI00082CBA69|nr:Rieske (2Fe-2S) protein [Novosphingobium lentum]